MPEYWTILINKKIMPIFLLVSKGWSSVPRCGLRKPTWQCDRTSVIPKVFSCVVWLRSFPWAHGRQTRKEPGHFPILPAYTTPDGMGPLLLLRRPLSTVQLLVSQQELVVAWHPKMPHIRHSLIRCIALDRERREPS